MQVRSSLITLTFAVGSLLAGCSAASNDSAELGVSDTQQAAVPVPTGAIAACPLGTSCFWVTNTLDAGIGSLRQAIINANAAAKPAEVRFYLTGATQYVIQPLTNLPTLNGGVFVNGYSQPGSAPPTAETRPLLPVVIDGSNSAGMLGGLVLNGAFNTVKGLHIRDFPMGSGCTVNGDDNTVSGNILIENAQAGVNLNAGERSLVGGPLPEDRNIILRNGVQGVLAYSDRNLIQGNSIGTNYDGELDAGNGGGGVEVWGDGNVIGGTGPGEGNLIYNNEGGGVIVWDGIGNMISHNSFRQNVGMAIDLNGDGPTFNDGAPDEDLGPNELQNFPRLTSMTVDGDSKATLQYYMNSVPNRLVRLEFYEVATCDDSGRGEAERFIGARANRMDGQGQLNTEWKLPGKVTPGSYVTALAVVLDADQPAHGSTSEFSPCLLVP